MPFDFVGVVRQVDGESLVLAREGSESVLFSPDPSGGGRPLGHRLSFDGRVSAQAFVAHPEGGAILSVSVSSDEPGFESAMCLMRVEDGRVLWQRLYRPIVDGHILVRPSGEVLSVGKIDDDSFAILEWSAAGALLRQEAYRVPLSLGTYAFGFAVDAALVEDGGLVVGASTGEHMGLIRFAGDGTLAWAKLYPGMEVVGVPILATKLSFVSVQDGQITVLGDDNADSFFVYDSFLMAFDLDGRPSWSYDLTHYSAVAFSTLSDGSFLLAMNYNTDLIPPLRRALILHVSRDGELLSSSQIQDGDGTNLAGLVSSPEDEAIVLHRSVDAPEDWFAPSWYSLEQLSLNELFNPPCGAVGLRPRFDARTFREEPLAVTPIPIAVPVEEAPLALVPRYGFQEHGCEIGCPIDCSGTSISNRFPSCAGEDVELTVAPSGEPPFTVVWDVDGDGIPDGPTGTTLILQSNLEEQEVVAWVGDACSAPETPCRVSFRIGAGGTNAVPEVSDVRAGAIPLRVRKHETQPVSCESVPEARDYGLMVGALGDFDAALPEPVTACRAQVSEGAEGLEIEADLPVNSWVLVVGRSRCASGPAGADSFGTERSGGAGWLSCDP